LQEAQGWRAGPEAPRKSFSIRSLVMTIDTLSPVKEREISGLRSALRKCFSFPVLLGTVIVAANFGIEKSLRLDPDTWWHIKYGDIILKTGHWPTIDNWSFTVNGMPRMAYEWGGEVITALAYRLGGLRGLDVLLITLTSVLILLFYYFAWLRSRNPKAAFIATILLLPVAAMCFTLRPQLLGYIFLLVTLILLERFRHGEQKHLWLLPPIFLIWVNTHGSFTLGFMVLGLCWLSGLKEFSCGGLHAIQWRPAQRLHLELVGLLSVAVLPITPYGTRLATVPLEVGTSLPVNFADIMEWQPLNFGFWEAKLLLILMAGFVLALISFRLRFRLDELALFFIVTYLTFVHFRFVILYAIIFAPFVASILARWMPAYDPKIDKYAFNAVLIVIALVVLAWNLPSETALQKHVENEYPVQTVHYLRHHPLPGRMFNEYAFGGYLVWAMAPEHKVFIDGRGDIFEQAGVFSDYMGVTDLKRNALAVLQSYRIDSCMIYRNSPLATLLAASPEWKQAYKDNLSALFVRVHSSRNHPDSVGR
jgi:hypothetical protein